MSQKIDYYFIVKMKFFTFRPTQVPILKSHYKRHKNFWSKLVVIFHGKDTRTHKIGKSILIAYG